MDYVPRRLAGAVEPDTTELPVYLDHSEYSRGWLETWMSPILASLDQRETTIGCGR
jgi:hypothetical protein